MFELLVPATKAQMDRSTGSEATYDLQVAPGADAPGHPARCRKPASNPTSGRSRDWIVGKTAQRIVAVARRGGRSGVGCIVLGHGADEQKVVHWLKVAASVPGFIGFAVGRTTFWDAVADYVGKRATRAEAVSRIADRYREWSAIFSRGQAP